MKVVIAFASNALFNFAIGLLLAKFLGPEDYGRFAVAVAVAVMVQTIAFDWTRLAAARFYSDRVRAEQPTLRATIDTSFALLILLLGLGTAIMLLSGVELSLSRGLVALAIGTAVANGVFDYQAALMRARFLDGIYARLIIGKNVLSMVLTVGAAFFFGSAKMALLGVILSMMGAMLGVRQHLLDRDTSPRLADARLAKTLFGYGLPIVLANLLYQSIPLVDRLAIARSQGFAASGQFSFAYDIGVRIVAAIGSMLDVLLFQVAVRADEILGSDQAKRQIGDNIGMVIAVLTPACVGCGLVLPSFEQLAAPAEFRGTFGRYLLMMLPGLYCYGLIFFALHPLFQIRKQTLPLILVAALASLGNVIAILTLPDSADATRYTIAVSLSLLLGLVLLVIGAILTRPVWPRLRDVLGTAVATGCMVAAVAVLPASEPGVQCLVMQMVVGVTVYGGLAVMFDLCDVRRRLGSHRSFEAGPQR